MTTATPRSQLFEMLLGYIKPQMLYVAAKLGVCDYLQYGPLALSELAARTQAHPDSLQRLLRGLVNIGVLCEDSPNEFSLTELGVCLTSDAPNSLREMALLQGGLMYPAWANLLNTVQSGQPAFEQTYGAEFFDYLAQHSDYEGYFNTFMVNTAHQAAKAVREAYDLADVNTLVDVGGGSGVLLATLLKAYPQLSGVLLDLPAAVAQAERLLQADGLTGRCQLIAGDFFEAVPTGGDVYVLSQILHDWPDSQAVAILQNCRAAMSADSKLLIFEHILPERVVAPCKAVEQDLVMLVLTGGRERTLAQFADLLAQANLKVHNVIPTHHARRLIEVGPL